MQTLAVGGEPRTFADDWADAADDEERRTILGHAVDRIVVGRGKQGAWTDTAKLARMTFEWQPMGQVTAPEDGDLATWASA